MISGWTCQCSTNGAISPYVGIPIFINIFHLGALVRSQIFLCSCQTKHLLKYKSYSGHYKLNFLSYKTTYCLLQNDGKSCWCVMYIEYLQMVLSICTVIEQQIIIDSRNATSSHLLVNGCRDPSPIHMIDCLTVPLNIHGQSHVASIAHLWLVMTSLSNYW